MNKEEFLLELIAKLSPLPVEEIEDRLNYYSEMIDDRMEDGWTEEAAVAALGSLDDIAAQILTDLPLRTLVKAQLKPRRTVRAWEVVLLILGFPLWFPLLLSALIVILAVYVSIWSVVVSLYAANLALAASALAGLVAAIPYGVGGNMAAGTFLCGGGLLLAGLAILMFLGCNQTAKGALWLGKALLRGIKSCFLRKEAVR